MLDQLRSQSATSGDDGSQQQSPAPYRMSSRNAYRRSHGKSRTGCKNCKRRKIKCDEQRPSCRNCLKHRVDCEFVVGLDAFLRPRNATTAQPNSDLNMFDLELMHHYTTSAYATLSCEPVLRNLWRGPVVELAFTCDYVMRTILAVSALHLAHHRPEKKDFYVSIALTYHQIASRQALGLLSDVAKEDVVKLFMFSSLTIFVALGGPRNPSDGLLFIGESSFPDWIFLLRGTKSLIAIAGQELSRGPLAPLFTHAMRRWEILHPPEEAGSCQEDVLGELQALVDANVGDEEALRIYNHATTELRGVLRAFDTENGASMGITDAFVWIHEVTEEFLPLLRVPTQEALAIFAHFCVLLKKLEIHWWMQGWANHLMRRVHEHLDDEHRLWIRWPIEEIGWVPPRN
ncbi:hypothetical protein K469DRAFT_751817 [Zopfia rhizophila CBS 207.26]|uniref:Zn(2)-C6 fungal-type domain-containing protein n=1 Tax=Zopfia rhizophila CBS 207.26 TaxID=1314779 RepID=A0A6A6DZ60_9PEZI|nr:hypothetical protein K469DRAFT_751817 [Zopfia rhizophila CBS 207.26]